MASSANDNHDFDVLPDDIPNIFGESDSEDEFEGFTEDDFPLAYLMRGPNETESEGDEDEDASEGDALVWDENSASFLPNDLPEFTGNPGLQLPVPDNARPIDFFKMYFTEEMIELLVEETNRFAKQYLDSQQLKAKSRSLQWKEVNSSEMKVFMAIIFAMGLVQKQDLQEYWSTNEILSTPFFSKTMTRDRFLLIMKFLHFNNNTNHVPRGENGYDPLFKIRPFYECFKERLRTVYLPEKNLSIDESTIAWKGNLHFKVYNPNKAHKFHIKVFVLAEAESGLVLRYEIYSGKAAEPSEHGATYDIVMKLLQEFFDKGHHVYMDNYYSGVRLYLDIFQRTTMACGTVRLNRKLLPAELKTRLKKGEIVALRTGSLLALKWKDKRDVSILSTVHTSALKDTGKVDRQTNEPIVKPEAIIDYNKHMGGVDRGDQLWQYFGFARITRKAYKKMFFHMQHICEVQAYLIYKKVTDKPILHRKFCQQLIKDLILESGMQQQNQRPGRRSADANDISRLTGRHFPSAIIAKDGAKRKNPLRKCFVCSSHKQRRETRYECKACDSTPLCVDPCFAKYHTEKYF